METTNVRLRDFSQIERQVLQENDTSIRKLFLAKGIPSVNSEEDEFRVEIKTFLKSYIAIFSSYPQARVDLNNNDDQNGDPLEAFVTNPSAKAKCLSRFRSVYRRYFRVATYLTWDKLQACHSEAKCEALKKWMELSSASCETIQLKESMKQEKVWISKVNSWKKEKLLEQIKCEVLETIKNEAELELPYIFGDFGENQEYFYKKDEFTDKCREIRKRAVQRYTEEITPLIKEDSNVMKKQRVWEFRMKDVRRKLICHLVFRNTLAKFRYYWNLTKNVEQAVKEYGERLDSFLYPTSIYTENFVEMNPNLIFEESEMLRKAMIPTSIFLWKNERVRDLEKIDMKIIHLKKYQKEIQSKFGEVVRNAALIGEGNLIRCEIDTEEVLGKMMGELKDIFVRYNLSKEHVDRWQERVEGELLMAIRKRKKFSIANQKHVERLLVESQLSTEEALQKINADFGNLPMPMLMSSDAGATSFIDGGSSDAFDLSRACWKVATAKGLLSSMMELPTSYLISLLNFMSPPSIFPGHCS